MEEKGEDEGEEEEEAPTTRYVTAADGKIVDAAYISRQTLHFPLSIDAPPRRRKDLRTATRRLMTPRPPVRSRTSRSRL